MNDRLQPHVKLASLALVLAAVAMAAEAVGADSPWRMAPNVHGQPAFAQGERVDTPFFFWQVEIDPVDQRAMDGVGVSRYELLSSAYPRKCHYWPSPDSYDMAKTFAPLDDVLSRNPRAQVLPRLFAWMPNWWAVAHPNECVTFSNPAVPQAQRHGQGGYLRVSYASELARRELTPRFRRAVGDLLGRYGDRLMGLHVCGGPCGEYFSWDADFLFTRYGSPAGDVSEPMQQAFRAYLRRKYDGKVERLRAAWKDETVTFDTARVPEYAERCRLNAEGWRDPAEGRKVPDYFECNAEVIAEDCEYWCRQAKEVAGKDFPTVVFFGYTMDEPWGVEADHRAISKLYRSKYVDVFTAPHTYHRRRLGQDGEMRQYLASAALHGKLFVDEGDECTHLERLKGARADGRCMVTNGWESQQLLWREFGMSVSHGAGIWYMDLYRGNFHDPELVKTIGKAGRLADEAMKAPREHLSEVVVISNPESEYYMPYRCGDSAKPHPRGDPANICHRLYHDQVGAFYRAGAPFDWYLADDLDAVADRRDVKAAVLLDCQYLTPGQIAAIERMKKRGVRFLAFHKPAYVSQTDLSEARSRKLLQGMVHFPEPNAKPADLRAFYRAAGVHLYTESDIVLSANKSWILLHARESGEVRLRLPRSAKKVVNVVDDAVLSRDSDTVALKLRKHETAVLRIFPFP